MVAFARSACSSVRQGVGMRGNLIKMSQAKVQVEPLISPPSFPKAMADPTKSLAGSCACPQRGQEWQGVPFVAWVQ